MTPKQIIVLMRSLGVGKENYEPPLQARPWTTAEFLTACTRSDVMRRAEKFPPEKSTIDGWFSANGPVPDDRREAWHYFFHVFFSRERRAFGTQEWKAAYFAAVDREKTREARARPAGGVEVPLEEPDITRMRNILPFLRRPR